MKASASLSAATPAQSRPDRPAISQSWVNAVALPPEGTMLVSGDLSGVVKLWDVPSKSETATLSGHNDTVWCASFSPDGKAVATGGGDQTVRLWDPLRGSLMASLPTGFPVWSLAFSPDGRVLAAGGSSVRIWETSSQKQLKTLPANSGNAGTNICVAFSSKGLYLATGHDDGQVVLWNWREGTPVSSCKAHDDRVICVTFSHDDAWLASAGEDTKIALYDVARSQLTDPPLKGHVYWIFGLAFTHDDRSLASASLDGTLKLWNLATRQVALTLRGHIGPVTGVAFSNKGTLMATSGADGGVRLWPAAPLGAADPGSQASQTTR